MQEEKSSSSDGENEDFENNFANNLNLNEKQRVSSRHS